MTTDEDSEFTEAESAAMHNLRALAMWTRQVYELRIPRDGGPESPSQYEVYVVWEEKRLQIRIAADPDPVAAVAAAWRHMCPNA
jgi:hypothetical protein